MTNAEAAAIAAKSTTAATAAGGNVIGIAPKLLMEKEIMHRGLTELHVVETIHERKVMMMGLADAFLILPGGYGTLDELFEVLTLEQLKAETAYALMLRNWIERTGRASR